MPFARRRRLASEAKHVTRSDIKLIRPASSILGGCANLLVGAILIVPLALGSAAYAQEDACARLERLFEQDLLGRITQAEDKLRAIIEQGDVEQCRVLSLDLQAAVNDGRQEQVQQEEAEADTEEQAQVEQETIAEEPPAMFGSEVGEPIFEHQGFAVAEPGEIDVETLTGASVYGLNDEEVGQVGDLILNQEGQVEAVVIEVGGFLGLGEMPAAVPFSDLILLQSQAGDIRIYLDATEEQLEGSPYMEGEQQGQDIQIEAAATRLFGGPEDFPPDNFAAYAILASWSDPRNERERFIAICMAYATILTRADSAFAPAPEHQLVTVWPVESAELAQELAGGGPKDERCAMAVDRYDLETAREAMRDAETGSRELRRALAGREGPFLNAWNPSEDKGKPDVPIFRMDLSNVRTQAQAEAFFRLWRQGILDNAENWLDSWHDPGVRTRVRLFLENNAENATHAISEAAKAMAILMPGE